MSRPNSVKRMNLRVTEELYLQVMAQAEREERSLSSLVRWAVRRYLNETKEQA